jgi:hypothetical protein
MTEEPLTTECPRCKRKHKFKRYHHATENFRRTCACGIRWSITIRPQPPKTSGAVEQIHILEWNEIGA